jgi:hypothetical protein
MWPNITLSNGIVLEVKERASVVSLNDHIVETSYSGGNKVKVRAGDKLEVKHWPPGELLLVKVTPTRVREIVRAAKEGVDFELTNKSEKTFTVEKEPGNPQETMDMLDKLFGDFK